MRKERSCNNVPLNNPKTAFLRQITWLSRSLMRNLILGLLDLLLVITKEKKKDPLSHFVSGLLMGRKFSQVLVVRSDRKSTRLNSSHVAISYAVFCLKKKSS